MRSALLTAFIAAAAFLSQQAIEVAAAQEGGLDASAGVASGATATGNLGEMGGALSLGLTGGRRPFYRLQYSDTVEVNFPFAPEFNQSLVVQPDGFVAHVTFCFPFVMAAVQARYGARAPCSRAERRWLNCRNKSTSRIARFCAIRR